ncbi:hypothetical protein [Glaciecola sp. KUL10]|uniref:hypothetical protein n=1 Tax=Glaciecola sp. (strain KUL10) TaxID=2161813 RepID=UPI000D936EF5|nr:hypothetical protein [Glaciecola sp. KUL10]GBL05747.1 Dnd system-associated protein 3 [Glaciecola sp. KUL10]
MVKQYLYIPTKIEQDFKDAFSETAQTEKKTIFYAVAVEMASPKYLLVTAKNSTTL